jgi:hypothetical protein
MQPGVQKQQQSLQGLIHPKLKSKAKREEKSVDIQRVCYVLLNLSSGWGDEEAFK